MTEHKTISERLRDLEQQWLDKLLGNKDCCKHPPFFNTDRCVYDEEREKWVVLTPEEVIVYHRLHSGETK
jgi:hypothetical protein